MSRNYRTGEGVQQTKDGSLARLDDIRLILGNIQQDIQQRQQQEQQGQQIRTIQPGQRQDETVSPSITTDTEPLTDTSPQSINPRNQRVFFPPFVSTSSTSVVNQSRSSNPFSTVPDHFRSTSSTSIDNQQGGNYLYPGFNTRRSLRQQGRESFRPISSTSVGKQREQYDYFNDPTIAPEERAIRRKYRDIRQARAREANPNLDLEKWRQDDEAKMRRLSLNIKNTRLGNAPTSFDNDLGPTSNRSLFLGRRYAPDMSSPVIPPLVETTSSTSGGNDLAPDQNNVEPQGGNLVTSNIPIGGPVPLRTNAPARRGKKRGLQQQHEQSDRKRLNANK